MPNKLEEILNQLTGNLQKPLPNTPLEDLSPVRKKSLIIFRKLDSLSNRYVQSNILKATIKPQITKYIENIIVNKISDDELKKVLKECFDLLQEDFTDVSIAKELKQNINPGFESKVRDNGTRKNSISDLNISKELAELL